MTGEDTDHVGSVFVIGATGFVGDGVARHLAGEGRRVTERASSAR